jgi:hypothetical protein
MGHGTYGRSNIRTIEDLVNPHGCFLHTELEYATNEEQAKLIRLMKSVYWFKIHADPETFTVRQSSSNGHPMQKEQVGNCALKWTLSL